MTSFDPLTFCEYFFQATYIPISHLSYPANLITTFPKHSYSLDFTKKLAQRVYFTEEKRYFLSDAFAFFGYVPIENTSDYLVFGPVFSAPMTNKHSQMFMDEFKIQEQDSEEVRQLLSSTPILSLRQCLSLLSFLELIINHRIENFELQAQAFDLKQKAINQELSRIVSENREESFVHNSYQFERALNHAISIGNRTLLMEILSDGGNITNGIVADNSLRQQKNTLIASVTLATRAAIEGGLEVEHAYSLSDLYIQESERMETVEDVIALTGLMYVDFTERVAKNQFRTDINSDVFRAVQFIQNNINRPLTVEDVAQVTGYSYSYFKTIFKSELNMSISTFITKTKLEAAKELLAYSDYSLSYISNYLCFSSQSYFQNQFKKWFGVTPLAYRKRSKKSLG